MQLVTTHGVHSDTHFTVAFVAQPFGIMGFRMKRALVALCNSIRAIFRKKRQPSHLKRRTRDRGSTDRTPRCVVDDQNVNTSSVS